MKNILILLFLLICNDVFAQLYNKDITVKPKHYNKNVDFEIQAFKKIVVKNVSINGSKKKYNFLFDTGSNLTYISKKIADEIKFIPTIKDSVSDGYTSKLLDFGKVEIDIKDVCFKDVYVGIDESVNNELLCIDGIIGFNLISKSIWKIDLSKNILLFTDDLKNIKDKEEYYSQKIFIIHSLPYVVCGFENIYRATMLFDLGDNSTIYLYSSYDFLTKRGKIFKSSGINITQSSFSTEIDTLITAEKIMFNKFNFGKTTKKRAENLENFLKYPVADIENINTSNVIGAGILDYYSLIMDFPHKKIYTRLFNNQFELSSYGIAIGYFNKHYEVLLVWENSPAQKQNIKPGDIILQINNLDLQNFSHNPPCILNKNIEEELKKDTIELRIKNVNDKVKIYTLTKENIFLSK